MKSLCAAICGSFGILFLLTACDLKSNKEHSFLLDKELVDTALKNQIENNNLPGASALIYIDGKEAYFGAFGMADRESREPMSRETLVQIFSMTKPVTGVALMTLYEEGKFELNAPLEKYAPEFANLMVYAGENDDGEIILEEPERLPTIYDVLRHTAGFSSNHAGDNPVNKILKSVDPLSRENTLAEMAEKLGSVPLLSQPGSRWLYGPSVDVQAFLVERLSGMAFDDYVQEKILTPLKMHNTQYVLNADKLERMAALYNRQEDGSFTREPDESSYSYYTKDWPMKYGGWGLTSNLDDYMRFARMLVNGGELDGIRILKPETVALMATDAMPDTVTDISWLSNKGQVGFGVDFAVRTASPASAEEASGEVGEFFWDGAANTLFWVDPVNKLTAVLFTQYKPFGRVPLHKAFRDAVYANDETASSLLLNNAKATAQ